jgi:hypothetical protein
MIPSVKKYKNKRSRIVARKRDGYLRVEITLRAKSDICLRIKARRLVLGGGMTRVGATRKSTGRAEAPARPFRRCSSPIMSILSLLQFAIMACHSARRLRSVGPAERPFPVQIGPCPITNREDTSRQHRRQPQSADWVLRGLPNQGQRREISLSKRRAACEQCGVRVMQKRSGSL